MIERTNTASGFRLTPTPYPARSARLFGLWSPSTWLGCPPVWTRSCPGSGRILRSWSASLRSVRTGSTRPRSAAPPRPRSGSCPGWDWTPASWRSKGGTRLCSSAPFDPEERDGRLYGRGVADDKAGVMAHVAALRAWEGRPPVSVKVIVEGEEEIGSEHLTDFLSENRELLRADAVILADGSNWRIGWPALTTSLRGLVDCEFEVRVLDHAVHSGMYGGPIPDAVTVLARTLATLHDDAGNVAVAGLTSASADPLDLTEEELRADAGVRPSVRLIGEGGLTERLWTRPAVSVLGIDAPRIDEAANQLV